MAGTGHARPGAGQWIREENRFRPLGQSPPISLGVLNPTLEINDPFPVFGDHRAIPCPVHHRDPRNGRAEPPDHDDQADSRFSNMSAPVQAAASQQPHDIPKAKATNRQRDRSVNEGERFSIERTIIGPGGVKANIPTDRAGPSASQEFAPPANWKKFIEPTYYVVDGFGNFEMEWGHG